jgi:mannosyltransferase
MAAATSAMMVWNLGRPALWIDQSVTVIATQGTWRNLLTLLQGQEAPLVPYYALVKATSAASRQLIPALNSHLEILFRWPSAVAMALAGWALIRWLARLCPARVVVSTAVIFVALYGVSRYGQDVRPYAFVVLAGVICTIVWARLVQTGDHQVRWLVLYALSVVALVMAHSLAAALVVAHAVAALATAYPGSRWSALLRTAAGAAIGLLVVSPFALLAARNGTGTVHKQPLTAGYFRGIFVDLFTHSPHPLLGLGPVLLLGLIGMSRVFSAEYRFVARLATSWAVVPPAALLPIIVAKPNLLIGRYVIVVIPAWAILAGLGVVTLADLFPAMIRRLSPRLPQGLERGLAAVLAGAVLVAVVTIQWPALTKVRTAIGPGEDIRPALAAAERGDYSRLPLLVTSDLRVPRFALADPLRVAELLAYDGERDHTLEPRLANARARRNPKVLWPFGLSAAKIEQNLANEPRVVLLMRVVHNHRCAQRPPANLKLMTTCMPVVLWQMKYRVVETSPDAGPGWSLSVLQRH